jgi:hypothetical protein
VTPRSVLFCFLAGVAACGGNERTNVTGRGPTQPERLRHAPAESASGAPGSKSPGGGSIDELRLEEREEDPRSQKVKLKVVVVPTNAKGFVYWGPKKLGPTGPKPLELERPRHSGPMDIVVRAEGYLPFHTRLFTDRDDRVAVYLSRGSEAASLPGYREPTPSEPEPTP